MENIDKLNEVYDTLEDLAGEYFEKAYDDSLLEVDYRSPEYKAYRHIEEAREALHKIKYVALHGLSHHNWPQLERCDSLANALAD
jgi:ribonuclease HI